MNPIYKEIVIIGGGASGFFTAIQIAEKNPKLQIVILEKSPKVLEKVKISGGGRCNVTHACFTPKELVKYYPRGNKELLGPFHQFMTGDMISWLSENGVETKIEEDGRIFPNSNSSQTIIDCFQNLIRKYKIEVKINSNVQNVLKEGSQWKIETKSETYLCDKIIFASGSSRKIWDILSTLNHSILNPVPSLFTFKIKDKLIQDLAGISIQNCITKVKNQKRTETGPILITHKGLSGPGILKLSAWEAIIMSDSNYDFILEVNWIHQEFNAFFSHLKQIRDTNSKQKFASFNTFGLPKRFWKRILSICDLEMKNFAEVSNKHLLKLAKTLTRCEFQVNGKNTNKDEFVTCGGVELSEIDFKTMQSKVNSNMYFVGEVINVDAVTGGFNFQNAWTTSFIAARGITLD